jgi:hypothetical protein
VQPLIRSSSSTKSLTKKLLLLPCGTRPAIRPQTLAEALALSVVTGDHSINSQPIFHFAALQGISRKLIILLSQKRSSNKYLILLTFFHRFLG